jgi:uncharacterized protein (DUF934 family)
MPLVRSGQIVEDPFIEVLDGAVLDDHAAVILPAARFLADAQDIVRRTGLTGVRWPNDRNVSELAPWLDRLALVVLVFPTFKDGRAYSQARILREQLHFRGELRASGQVLRDQFLFLHRAGFDSFDVRNETDAAVFAESIRRYSVFYQPSADGAPSAFRRRFSRRAAPKPNKPAECILDR